MKQEVYILGAGPAGLMAAYELLKNGYNVSIIEKSSVVGGQCKTNTYKTKYGEYRFDLGGHRFITHNKQLLVFVEKLLKDDLLISKRKSVIRFKNRVYNYPLNLFNLIKIAPFSLLFFSFIDLIKISLKLIKKDDTSFESWISSRFGNTLYKNFFAPYTKKLWGIEPKNLSSDWAGQRISLVDIKDIVKRLFNFSKNIPRTYARLYRYPKYGFGQLTQNLAKEVINLGGKIYLNEKVEAIQLKENKIKTIITNKKSYSVKNIISTMPLNEMALMCGIKKCNLSFRALRFLNIALKDIEDISDNTWQYLSDLNIKATRLQEPKRRSSFMSPKNTTSIMLEIPCNKDDKLWKLPQEELLSIILKELKSLGYDLKDKIVDTFSSYEEYAYTLMDLSYKQERNKTISYLNKIDNLLMCGRQGTFRYIFVDTAMETGIMAAQKLMGANISKQSIYNHRNEKTVIETQSII